MHENDVYYVLILVYTVNFIGEVILRLLIYVSKICKVNVRVVPTVPVDYIFNLMSLEIVVSAGCYLLGIWHGQHWDIYLILVFLSSSAKLFNRPTWLNYKLYNTSRYFFLFDACQRIGGP